MELNWKYYEKFKKYFQNRRERQKKQTKIDV